MYKMMKGGGCDVGWAYNMVDLITKVAQQVGIRRFGDMRGEKATGSSKKRLPGTQPYNPDLFNRARDSISCCKGLCVFVVTLFFFRKKETGKINKWLP